MKKLVLNKIITLTVFSWLLSFCEMKAQVNLVMNPSFETFTACPTAPDHLIKCSNWKSYRNSPDYFHPCTNPGSVGVPVNWGGYQNPASGNAYAAFANYGPSNYREYLGSQLSGSLIPGTKYFISFKVALSLSNPIQANCASSKMGVKFSTVSFGVNNPYPINYTPAIYSNAIVTDSLNWTRIFGAFVSDSAYKYLIIGNFFNNLNTDTLIMSGPSNCTASYYYLDDICVSIDSVFASQYDFSLPNHVSNNEIGGPIKFFPNPATDKLFIEIKNASDLMIQITDIYGEILISTIVNSFTEIDLSQINRGLYFVRAKKDNHFTIYKLLKQ